MIRCISYSKLSCCSVLVIRLLILIVINLILMQSLYRPNLLLQVSPLLSLLFRGTFEALVQTISSMSTQSQKAMPRQRKGNCRWYLLPRGLVFLNLVRVAGSQRETPWSILRLFRWDTYCMHRLWASLANRIRRGLILYDVSYQFRAPSFLLLPPLLSFLFLAHPSSPPLPSSWPEPMPRQSQSPKAARRSRTPDPRSGYSRCLVAPWGMPASIQCIQEPTRAAPRTTPV